MPIVASFDANEEEAIATAVSPAASRAKIGGDVVAVIAFLTRCGIDESIGAPNVGTIRITSGRVIRVAIAIAIARVALLASGCIVPAVAASRYGAIGIAGGRIQGSTHRVGRVAWIALLAACHRIDETVTTTRLRAISITPSGIPAFIAFFCSRVFDTIATERNGAIVVARGSIVGNPVTVSITSITFLAIVVDRRRTMIDQWIDQTVATAWYPAIGIAVDGHDDIAGHVFAVITLFRYDAVDIGDPVAAALVRGTARAAAIPRHHVAVVAFLARIEKTIATAFEHTTIRTAPVTRNGVAVIADLAHGAIDDAIATALVRSTVRTAAITRNDIAIITYFPRIHDAITTVLEDPTVLAAAITRDDIAIITYLAIIELAVAAAIGQDTHITWAKPDGTYRATRASCTICTERRTGVG